jgi:hypothetical protein
MPELAFAPNLDLPGKALYLAAVMAFPRNPERHQEFLDASQNLALRRAIRKVDPETRVPAWLAAMVAEQTIEDLAREEGLVRFGPGEIAGLIFVQVLASADVQPQPSKSVTLKNVRETLGPILKKRGLGGASRSHLVEQWHEFRPAAHLLAARLFLPGLWREIGGDIGRLNHFLSLAEALRRRGERHRQPGTRLTLLDPGESWYAPAAMGLPEIRLALTGVDAAIKQAIFHD